MSRSSSTNRRRCSAPSAACSSASPITASCAPTRAWTRPTSLAKKPSCCSPGTPTQSARTLRAALNHRLGTETPPAIIITDSFGRAWRHGQVDIAIGCAGLQPLEDWRGRTDATGRELKATWIAVADELAAAADLARTKDGSLPLVLVRGADRHVTADDGPGAAAIIRPEAEDLFR